MIDIDLDYYLLQNDNKFQKPRLIKDQQNDPNGPVLQRVQKIENDTVYLTFGSPYQRKPEMVDYLFCASRAVFSNKIAKELNAKEIKGFKLIPAVIRDQDDNEYKDYWFGNVYQKYAFMDQEKSEKEAGSDPDDITWDFVDKMVIDTKLITKIPLEKRLIFAVEESTGYILYHKSIVDLIISTNPEGLIFIPIDKWYNGISYSM